MFSHLKYCWKSVAFTLLLFYLSFAKPANLNQLNVINITDKLAHYMAYVVYGLIIIFEFYKYNKSISGNKKFILTCILSPIILGGLIEIVQETFFKPRSAEWLDWACDITGILTAWLVFYLLLSKTKLLQKL